VLIDFDTNLNDVLLLYNTNQGKAWMIALKVERPYRKGWHFGASYLYGRSYALNDGTSSVARSNWANTPYTFYMNEPTLSRSNFDPGHRINASATIPLPLAGASPTACRCTTTG
jgi:hypothetical protein